MRTFPLFFKVHLMKNETMLYKTPGEHIIEGNSFDYVLIDANDEQAYDAAIADGWALTTPEALEMANKTEVPRPLKHSKGK